MTGFVPDFPLLFLNRVEAATIDALAEQILPSEEGSPGAREAGVTEYIDRALAGFLRELQGTYRRGFIALDALTASLSSLTLAEADEVTQHRVVAEMERLSREEPEEFVGVFFRIVREHTIQGFFCDPAYGGNRDLVGWRLVGFPGAQWSYSPEQMRPGADARRIPMLTLKDLYDRIGDAR